MDMMNWSTFLVIYALISFGFAYITGHALITRSVREWAYDFGIGSKLHPVEENAVVKPGSVYAHKLHPLRWLVLLLECPACLGWWIGFAAGYYFNGWPLALAASLFTTSTNFLFGRATGLIARPGDR